MQYINLDRVKLIRQGLGYKLDNGIIFIIVIVIIVIALTLIFN